MQNKIKILFAVGRLTIGGGEKLLVYQLKYLHREKFEPYLLTLFPEKEESFVDLLNRSPNSVIARSPSGSIRRDDEAIPRKRREIEIASLVPVARNDDDNVIAGSSGDEAIQPWQQLSFRGLFDIFSWFKLWRFLKKEKFDVVVTSLFSANLMVRLALLFSGRPKVLVSYEHNIYRDKHKWQVWMDWFLAKFTHKIIVDAESVKKFTAKQEGIPADKFLVMYIPPLSENFKGLTFENVRKEFGINPNDKVVLTVSRLVEEKGHIYLIRAAKEVIKSFPNAKFIIVGWGHLEQTLKDEVKKLGLENNVKLLGKRDIVEVLPFADIYVEPALSVDIGIASMEAMSAGLSIISTNVGEMPVFVKDGENGFLVPPADSNALAEKILTLLPNEDLRKKMGDKSRERVKDFSMEKYMEKFEELVFSILNSEFRMNF